MDWKWTVTAVLPVVTLVLGAWLTVLSEGRRDKAALRRELLARRIERTQALTDRREAFELTHLVEVNDLLATLFGNALRCNELLLDRLPLGEVGTNLQAANREMTKLTGLVLEDSVRQLVERAHREANRLSINSSGNVTAAAEAYEHVERAQQAIAERLRDIYKPSTPPDAL
ncbi:hypothetical protein [Streptomyces sp. NPDC001642]|uniref:hypothetical protein n=1 Tax=Streptomyces sp. NPDC001642 TaxID=3154392 RepID=UPI003324B2EE